MWTEFDQALALISSGCTDEEACALARLSFVRFVSELESNVLFHRKWTYANELWENVKGYRQAL
jgi:hypothetical protein